MKLDLGTFLQQWSVGGLLFTWVTTRRREVGLGYGWLMRVIYGLMAIGAAFSFASNSHAVASASAAATALSAAIALLFSYRFRAEGLARFDPRLDLLAPAVGTVGLFAAADFAGGGYLLALLRILVGAAFLGSITDAMLLGHWYLVQPGLSREPLQEIVRIATWIWPFEIVALVLPTGMVSVINGSIDDGYNGLLGWVWIACAMFTIGLVIVTRFALRERYYSAVMSATGLLYLAILTAFGTDLIARAVLAP
jgi:hypothetical protein